MTVTGSLRTLHEIRPDSILSRVLAFLPLSAPEPNLQAPSFSGDDSGSDLSDPGVRLLPLVFLGDAGFRLFFCLDRAFCFREKSSRDVSVPGLVAGRGFPDVLGDADSQAGLNGGAQTVC
jgi:hypothetical protein